MIAILIVIALISLNHTVDDITEGELGYDVTAVDICIGVGFILYMFL